MDQKIQSGKLRKKKNREGRKKYKDVKFENLPFCLSCFFCIEIRLFKPFSLFIFSIRERGRARSGRQSLHGQWDAINMTGFDVERLGFFKSKACLDKMATYTTLSSIEKHLREYIRYLHPHNPIPPPPITNAETTETAIGTTNKRFFCTHPVNREMSLFFFSRRSFSSSASNPFLSFLSVFNFFFVTPRPCVRRGRNPFFVIDVIRSFA